MSDTSEPAPAYAAPSGAPAALYPPPSEPSGSAPVPVRPPLNGLAVAALICGLLGLAPAAIVLGHVGFAQAGRSGQRGRGIAVAGLVLGYLVVVLAVAGWFAYTAFVGALRTGGYLPA
ncbi:MULTISPECIES: DUF4190 domain-containing protein [unclassified Rathayibacter]|uniref:DUF4190 domain-containing protein n=1 Tax=unclassified Rathayibacter TaxID=2609250 RepID=UPI0006F9E8BC|nr:MULTISPECIES: DUF4190 domain-containing protein [unclassified Rathayibacter]KQQ05194.1 hypothetical protein ASF42_00815 [Rathayibacter sp. Leaf294]KQS13057.1 hypothetical protein ASG06_00815 [Rathayibacter sp. Leaf185]